MYISQKDATRREKERHRPFLGKRKFSDIPQRYVGFDIETYDDNKRFLCGSISSPTGNIFFTDKSEMRKEFFNKKYRYHIFVASNLGFDFFGLFFGHEYIRKFRFIMKGSSLLYATCYNMHGDPVKDRMKGSYKVTFIDTMNYSPLSVQDMGKIISVDKLEKPACLGNKPGSMAEWDQMRQYNIRDSVISRKYMEFLDKSFRDLGVRPKLTIASTSKRLFQNKYLKEEYTRMDADIILDLFNGYYGGRCEVFSRGKFKDLVQYDINSMYPYVMRKFSYPDPNSVRVIDGSHPEYINQYPGLSLVTVEAPYMDYPLLPFRLDKKLLFPYGRFTSWQSHIELKEAFKLGYRITKIHKMIYFNKTCEPFKDFVDDLYAKRIMYQKDNNPMQYVVKILLNSLYGKFGEKFFNKETIEPMDMDLDELKRYDDFDRLGEFIRYKKIVMPPTHCIPIWALYVTAYARLEIYKYITQNKAVYCDTDCIMTEYQCINTSSDLGSMKIERKIDEVTIVKPKMYCIKGMYENRGKHIIKLKGAGKKLDLKDFQRVLKKKPLSYIKIAKFKEAIRKSILPNQNIPIEKLFSLEDTKRFWKNKFSPDMTEASEPLFMNDEFSDMNDNKIILDAISMIDR